jgi:hypothetical protein
VEGSIIQRTVSPVPTKVRAGPPPPRPAARHARAAWLVLALAAAAPGCRRDPPAFDALWSLCRAFRDAPPAPHVRARFEYATARLTPTERSVLAPWISRPTGRERAAALRALSRREHLETDCFGMLDALDADEDSPVER